jgi:lipopolysaccharide transport system permease protein
VIGVVAVDLQKGFDFVLGMVLYVTPVIYSSKVANPLLQEIIQWNPLTYLIGGVRDLIIYGEIVHFDRFIYSSLLAMLIFFFSWRIFYISEDKVIEKMI